MSSQESDEYMMEEWWMVNLGMKCEDWGYMDSTGSGKGEWIIDCLEGNWEFYFWTLKGE